MTNSNSSLSYMECNANSDKISLKFKNRRFSATIDFIRIGEGKKSIDSAKKLNNKKKSGRCDDTSIRK